MWHSLANKWGVENSVPPWKSSLDGMCDALDESACKKMDRVPNFMERRLEEDILHRERYSNIPYPESQLVCLAHSLIARGLFTEEELADKLELVRTRLAY
ncbi:thiocyanate hydrolase [Mycobacteroides immunogenum]|uniref:Thiocyanate hydrolase n=1 Tax=Mycobacteroides immunogenum TaxID=83262 RepID=A0A179VHS9_9MYCO|nr:thiocyanate hydrolase [Mycobacteroides immunogenum]